MGEPPPSCSNAHYSLRPHGAAAARQGAASALEHLRARALTKRSTGAKTLDFFAREVMKRLQSKVAIVTASTRGIGLEIARRLCSEGASVVVSSRKADAVQAAVDELRGQGLVVEGTSCHVGNAADRQKLLDFTLSKFGRCPRLFAMKRMLSGL